MAELFQIGSNDSHSNLKRNFNDHFINLNKEVETINLVDTKEEHILIKSIPLDRSGSDNTLIDINHFNTVSPNITLANASWNLNNRYCCIINTEENIDTETGTTTQPHTHIIPQDCITNSNHNLANTIEPFTTNKIPAINSDITNTDSLPLHHEYTNMIPPHHYMNSNNANPHNGNNIVVNALASTIPNNNTNSANNTRSSSSSYPGGILTNDTILNENDAKLVSHMNLNDLMNHSNTNSSLTLNNNNNSTNNRKRNSHSSTDDSPITNAGHRYPNVQSNSSNNNNNGSSTNNTNDNTNNNKMHLSNNQNINAHIPIKRETFLENDNNNYNISTSQSVNANNSSNNNSNSNNSNNTNNSALHNAIKKEYLENMALNENGGNVNNSNSVINTANNTNNSSNSTNNMTTNTTNSINNMNKFKDEFNFRDIISNNKHLYLSTMNSNPHVINDPSIQESLSPYFQPFGVDVSHLPMTNPPIFQSALTTFDEPIKRRRISISNGQIGQLGDDIETVENLYNTQPPPMPRYNNNNNQNNNNNNNNNNNQNTENITNNNDVFNNQNSTNNNNAVYANQQQPNYRNSDFQINDPNLNIFGNIPQAPEANSQLNNDPHFQQHQQQLMLQQQQQQQQLANLQQQQQQQHISQQMGQRIPQRLSQTFQIPAQQQQQVRPRTNNDQYSTNHNVNNQRASIHNIESDNILVDNKNATNVNMLNDNITNGMIHNDNNAAVRNNNIKKKENGMDGRILSISQSEPKQQNYMSNRMIDNNENAPGTEAWKRARLLERNRIAASKCRQRKKVAQIQLQHDFDKLSHENKIIKKKLVYYEKLISKFKKFTQSHFDNCHMNDNFKDLKIIEEMLMIDEDINEVNENGVVTKLVED